MIVIPPIAAGLVALQWLLDLIVLKNKEKIWLTDGFGPYVKFIVVTAVALIACMIFFKEPYGYVWVGALTTAVFGIRSALERKYIPDAHRHVVSLSLMGVCLAVTLLLAVAIY
ncbi:DUF4181 domain-containing protein [Saccharibacillus sp. CPCC 101409]|uniref:DUF4181 domain-containing protein n=1 Tax=Saccharibacillus sp. CPCC 101409 TaxID=3058041 RepID=UPI00267170C0|nr:DUF4181 domain-containing protein [Saccharibacillus sp. CPCC 101409]MDO3408502.1 DUF4181 domain-containing protein [Saccharibacillus sp. CPCC 101409]